MNINEECFAFRVLEKAENLNPRECHIFDYMLRNMSQDNVICLVPKEDFQRLHISKSEYYRIVKNLEEKNYICKILKEMIDTHTPNDVVYFMINPGKGFKQQKRISNLQEQYEILRKIRNIDTVAEAGANTYHTMSDQIKVMIDDGDDEKCLFFDVNTVRSDRKDKVGHPKFHLTNEACFTIFHMHGKYTVEDLARLYEVSPQTMNEYIQIAKERALSGELDHLEKGEYDEYEIN